MGTKPVIYFQNNYDKCDDDVFDASCISSANHTNSSIAASNWNQFDKLQDWIQSTINVAYT